MCSQLVMGDDHKMAADHFHWWILVAISPLKCEIFHLTPFFFKALFAQAPVIPEIYVQGLQVRL